MFQALKCDFSSARFAAYGSSSCKNPSLLHPSYHLAFLCLGWVHEEMLRQGDGRQVQSLRFALQKSVVGGCFALVQKVVGTVRTSVHSLQRAILQAPCCLGGGSIHFTDVPLRGKGRSSARYLRVRSLCSLEGRYGHARSWMGSYRVMRVENSCHGRHVPELRRGKTRPI